MYGIVIQDLILIMVECHFHGMGLKNFYHYTTSNLFFQVPSSVLGSLGMIHQEKLAKSYAGRVLSAIPRSEIQALTN